MLPGLINSIYNTNGLLVCAFLIIEARIILTVMVLAVVLPFQVGRHRSNRKVIIMTQTERIEKTTQIFSRADRNIINTTFNEVQSVMDDYLNEHLSSVSALESPFLIKALETRLQIYKEELKKHPDLLMLYDLLNSFEVNEKSITVTMPNIFHTKAGENDD